MFVVIVNIIEWQWSHENLGGAWGNHQSARWRCGLLGTLTRPIGPLARPIFFIVLFLKHQINPLLGPTFRIFLALETRVRAPTHVGCDSQIFCTKELLLTSKMVSARVKVLNPSVARVTVFLEGYGHDRTLGWIWHIWCDNNMIMALPINDRNMSMSLWSCPSRVMVMVWSSCVHAIVSAWSSQDRVMIVLSSCYSHTLVIGHNMVIDGHSWSFMGISLPCLGYLKVMPRSLLKVITGSWLIKPRQKQVEGMV